MKGPAPIEEPASAAATAAEFYRNLVDQAFDGISIIDFNGKIKYHNNSFANLFKQNGDDRHLKNIYHLIHEDDISLLKDEIKALQREARTPRAVTVRFRIGTGSWLYLALRVSNLIDDPSIGGILVSYRDITGKQMLRNELEMSEERHRSLMENSFDGICIVDFDGTAKYHSPSLLRILGYRPAFSVGGSILEWLHPDDMPVFHLAQEHWLSRKDEIFNTTIRFRHKNETWVTLEIRAMNLTDKPGIEGILINYRDVTESKKLEVALKESEKLYRKMVENAPEAMFIIDADACKFVDFNENALKIFKYSREEMLAMAAIDIVPQNQPDGRKSVEVATAKIREALAGGTTDYEVQYKDANGRLFPAHERMVRFPPYDRKLILGTAVDITESKKIEQALHESEERYKNIFELAPEAIFLIDTTSGRILQANATATRLFGYSREQLLNMKGIRLSPRLQPGGVSSLDFINERINEALQGLSPIYEWHHRDFSGKLFPCEVHITRFPPYDKKIIRGTVVDISERKAIEDRLQESEERYRNMVENAQETIFVIDVSNNRIVDFNQNAVNVFGFNRETLLNKRISDLFLQKQPGGIVAIDYCRQKAWEALKTGKAFMELTLLRSNGSTFPGEIHLSRFPPASGRLLRGSVHDISERREIERKLRQHELQYQHLAKVSPVGIFRTNSRGKTVFVNEKWCSISGMSPEQATGDGWMQAVHPEDKTRVRKAWREALKERKISRIEYRFLNTAGETRWVIGEAAPDFDDSGGFQGFAGSVTDITERVITEQAFTKSEQRNSVLLNAIPDMIFRLSKNGTFLDFKAPVGFKPFVPPEVFIGKKVQEILPPPVAETCMKHIRKALKTNTMQTFGYSLPEVKDGLKLNYFEARIVSYDSNEALALIRDITQQQEAEHSLRSSEARWRSLVQSAPQHIVTINSKNQICFVNNPRNVPMTGLKGMDVFELANHFRIDERPLRAALQQARKGSYNTLEVSLKNAEGEDVWFNVVSAPIKNSGKIEDLIIMALEITEQKKKDRELQLTNEKLKSLYQRIETVREEEKKKIAMEIHDQLGQELTAMKLGMFWLNQYIGQKKNNMELGRVQEKITSLIDLAGQTIGSARKIAHQLRPIVLDNIGLIPAIEWQIKTAEDSSKVRFTFRHSIQHLKLPDAFSVSVYRIIQESITNILRHAQARKVTIDLHAESRNLTLAIRDNGIGILNADIRQPGKIGIFGMKERAQNWKGSFDLSGKPGKGTELKITFPLNEITKNR